MDGTAHPPTFRKDMYFATGVLVATVPAAGMEDAQRALQAAGVDPDRDFVARHEIA